MVSSKKVAAVDPERDFFNEPTGIISFLLAKDYGECIARVRAFPQELSTWMIIAGKNTKSNNDGEDNDDDDGEDDDDVFSHPSTERKKRRNAAKNRFKKYYSRKGSSLKNFSGRSDFDDGYGDEKKDVAGGHRDGLSASKKKKSYVLRRLPIHFACSMIPDRVGSSSRGNNVKLEELISLMIECDPYSCKKADHEGKLPLHEAVQNDVSVSIVESLLRNYPQASQLRDTYGRTPISVRKSRCSSQSTPIEHDAIYSLLTKGVKYWLDGRHDSHVSGDESPPPPLTAAPLIEEKEEEQELSLDDLKQAPPLEQHKRGSQRMRLQRSSGSIAFDIPKDDLNTEGSPCDEAVSSSKHRSHALSKMLTPDLSSDAQQGRKRDQFKDMMETRSKFVPHVSKTPAPAPPSPSVAQAISPPHTGPITSNKSQGPSSAEERKYYKKYQHLKKEYKNLQNSNAQLEHQMKQMQMEKEDLIFRHKSRTKTTVSNLRADVAKLEDEKNVLMAAMEELKGRVDHLEIENDVLKKMNASAKKSAELSEDIINSYKLGYSGNLEESGELDHRLSAVGSVGTVESEVDEEDILTTAALSSLLPASPATEQSTASSATIANAEGIETPASSEELSSKKIMGLAAIKKVKMASMKLASEQAIPATNSQRNSTNEGSSTLIAAMKMLALAKKEHGDDLQAVATESLAAKAEKEVDPSDMNPQVYRYLQDENQKFKDKLQSMEEGKMDLEDQVHRLKLALDEVTSRRRTTMGRPTMSLATTSSAIASMAIAPKESSSRETGAPSEPQSAAAGTPNTVVNGKTANVMEDSTSSIEGRINAASQTAGVDGTVANSLPGLEEEEEPLDYQEEYHSLLEALESNNRYATEAFLTKRIRDLEFQLEDAIKARENDAAVLIGLKDEKKSKKPMRRPNEEMISYFTRYVLPQLKEEIKWLYIEGVEQPHLRLKKNVSY